MERTGRIRLGALILVVLAVATACSSSSAVTAAGPGGATSSPTEGSSGSYGSKGGSGYGSGGGSSGETSADVAGKSTFDLEADNDDGDYYFDPSTLKGTSGQTLTLHVENAGSVPHTFTIDDQNISVTLQPGDSQDVHVAFPDSGSVTFYCQFHQQLGMTGSLTVG